MNNRTTSQRIATLRRRYNSLLTAFICTGGISTCICIKQAVTGKLYYLGFGVVCLVFTGVLVNLRVDNFKK